MESTISYENSDAGLMTWRLILAPAAALVAHGLLLCFTAFLVLKLDGLFSPSWSVIFLPLWTFHAVLARVRFSLPAPFRLDRHRGPLHSIVATPIFVAFEVLLCVYLQSINDYGEPILNIHWVILPLAAWEFIVIFENIRRCIHLMPGEGQYMTQEAFWEILPHFCIGFGMVFMLTATVIAISKISGSSGPSAESWWDLFSNIGIAQLFGFLVWTKVAQPIPDEQFDEEISSLSESEKLDRLCNFKDGITGYIIMILLFCFETLLYLHLERIPQSAKRMPVRVIFMPVFILQIAGVLFGIWRLIEKLIVLFNNGTISEKYISFASKIQEYFMFLHCGSRVIGWWSIDEGSKEEQARLCYFNQNMGYNTFCNYPPERVNHMPRTFLITEVQRLQTALKQQTVIARESKEKFEGLKNQDKILCRICYAREINTVLLPCRHHVICLYCAERCIKCPICRESIEDRMLVQDAETGT
ncbi:hypothetical protein LUZ60_003125 [Juncus effusus]|nr:hypothetical protein LUZ60_003125 [Juncus effusus]